MNDIKIKSSVGNHFFQEILANAKSDIDLEIKINEVARHILTSSDLSKEEKDEAWSELLHLRTTYLQHVPVNLPKGSVLFFNMKQIGLAPTPLCPAYNKMRCVTISDYHIINPNIVVILLDPSALKHVPTAVLEKTGNLEGKKLDLMFTIVRGRPPEYLHRPINLCTHAWSHPHALEKDWIEGDVHMGIFPEIGFEHLNIPGSVAFNDISPMWVHTHYNYDEGAEVYSPDNAHFQVIPGSPFGIFWSVTQKDDRIAITKVIVIFDDNHPICASLMSSIRNCNSLDVHLERVTRLEKEIRGAFFPIIAALKSDNLDTAMRMINNLPLSFQLGIHKEVWLLAGSPKDIHNDFGKAAFENDPSLDVKFHCTNLDRAQAITNYANTLINLLITSEIALTRESQSLGLGDDTLKMMQCALLLESGQEKEAIELFHQFSWKEQDDVFLAIWELSKCPRGNMSFGKDTFLSPNTPRELKLEALRLAASRQTSKFEGRVIEIKEKAPIFNDIIITNNSLPPCILDPQPESPAIEIIEQTPPIIQTNIPQQSSAMTSEEVLEALIALAFDSQDFLSSGIHDRRNTINNLFNHLPIDIKNQVYGRVYEYSNDPNKGGPNWGENHVADDLNVLIGSLQDVLFGS